MQGFNKINEYTICYIKQLAGCHRDILPILVNLKSNTIMKKPHRKYIKRNQYSQIDFNKSFKLF